MHFKRFLDIKASNNNILIVFKNNKILYEPNLNTFLLEENLLNIKIKDHLYIGIANNGNDIFAVDISNFHEDINVGYETLKEYDLRHLLSISKPNDIILKTQAKYNNGIIEGMSSKKSPEEWSLRQSTNYLSSWNANAPDLKKIYKLKEIHLFNKNDI